MSEDLVLSKVDDRYYYNRSFSTYSENLREVMEKRHNISTCLITYQECLR